MKVEKHKEKNEALTVIAILVSNLKLFKKKIHSKINLIPLICLHSHYIQSGLSQVNI